MARPIDDIAAAIKTALSDALKENAGLFKEQINLTESETGGGSGLGSGDIVGIILSLAALGALADVEFEPIIAALKATQDGGGKEGVSFTVGWFLASTLLQFAQPITRQLQHMIEDANTSMILDPPTAAEMVTRGIISQQFGESEAGGGGFDKAHFSWMTQAAYNYPSVVETLAMWNRGYIDEPKVDALLTLNGVPADDQPNVKEMRKAILSPADWALAALRGNVTEQDAQAGAAQSGLTADEFATLMLNTGEPPAAQQLDMALRRDYISEAEYSRGIRQSRIRDEWIPTMLKLRYSPMSVAQAANAVTRGYLPYQDGAKIAQENGLLPDHWDYVYESNGRPPSHDQAAQLYHRGKITRAEFDQMVRESDIKDKYIGDVFELGVRLLPFFEASTLLKEGVITPATFTRNMLDQGYQSDTIKEIITAVESGKTGGPKHLSVSDYTTLYESRAYSRDQTLKGLEHIGYSPSDAAAIVAVVDAKAEAKIVSSQVTNIRSQFDRHKLDAKQAHDELVKLGLIDSEAKSMVGAWEVTRPVGIRQPTEAQTIKFFKDGLISRADAMSRLLGLGYDRTDAELLIKAYG